MADHALGPTLTEGAEEPSGRPHRLLSAGIVACVALSLVALAVCAHHVPYFAIDLTITRHVQGAQVAWIGSLLGPLNVLGFPPLVAIVHGTVILLILSTGARWEAAASGFATLGAAGLTLLVKALVARPRPPIDLVQVANPLHDSSFPAGHVLNFTAFVGFLGYLLCVRLAPSWPRATLIALLVTMMALMGLARIHAGDHWPSDVLGGCLIGIVWLAMTVEFYRWRGRRSWNRSLEHEEHEHS